MIARCALTTLLALTVLAPSASADSDLRLWTEVGVEKDLPKGFDVHFDQQTRFDQNISRLEAFMPEVTLWWRAHKYLRLGVGYRFQYRRDNDDALVLRHMGFWMIRPRITVGPLQLTYRLRYQDEIRENDERRYTLRNRLSVELLATKPWIPLVSAEAFHRLGDGEFIRLRKIRLTVGVERGFGDHEVELSYRIEVAQEDPNDPIPHILGVAYHYTL